MTTTRDRILETHATAQDVARAVAAHPDRTVEVVLLEPQVVRHRPARPPWGLVAALTLATVVAAVLHPLLAGLVAAGLGVAVVRTWRPRAGDVLLARRYDLRVRHGAD